LLKTSYFLTKKTDFPKIWYKNVQYFALEHAHKPKFGLCSNFFLAPFLSFFSVFLLSLPFTFHILSGCRKKLGVTYGKSLKMGPWSIIGVMGHFTTIFAAKLITLFSLLRQNAVDIQNRLSFG